MFPVKCFVHMIQTGNFNGYLDRLDKKNIGFIIQSKWKYIQRHKECYNSQSIRE